MARFKLWTMEEDITLRREYPVGGAEGCWKLLPRRTLRAITGRCERLGLKSGAARKPKVKYEQFEAPKPKRGPIVPIPEDTRDLTARFCGDPLPGRSALDRRERV